MNKKQLTALVTMLVLSTRATIAKSGTEITEDEARTLIAMQLRKGSKQLIADTAGVETDASRHRGSTGEETTRQNPQTSRQKLKQHQAAPEPPPLGWLGYFTPPEGPQQGGVTNQGRRGTMNILGYSRIAEDDGWLHTLTFQTDAGATVTIEDDTDLVTATSDTENALTIPELAKIWSEYGMGTSVFPDVPNTPEGKTTGYLPHSIVREMSGVELSHLTPE